MGFMKLFFETLVVEISVATLECAPLYFFFENLVVLV